MKIGLLYNLDSIKIVDSLLVKLEGGGLAFQVADKIRRDERVSVIERTNLRYLTGLPQKVDLVTLDLSFISILLVRILHRFLQPQPHSLATFNSLLY